MSKISLDEIADDGSIVNGFDYALQVWVEDGVIQKCGHLKPYEFCNSCKLHGKLVSEVQGHDVRI